MPKRIQTLSKRLLPFWCAACFIILIVAPASADIYRYIDSQGVMHFTNVPTSGQYKVYIKEHPQSRTVHVDADRYDRYIDEAAKIYGVDSLLLKAVIRAESAFDPQAVSKKGALGLMQIMPENLSVLQVNDPFDPWQNIMGGARYLKAMIHRFDGHVPLALAAYNAGPKAVDQFRGIPPFPETVEYVERVMEFFYLYKN